MPTASPSPMVPLLMVTTRQVDSHWAYFDRVRGTRASCLLDALRSIDAIRKCADRIDLPIVPTDAGNKASDAM